MLVCGGGVSEDCWKKKYNAETYQEKVIFKLGFERSFEEWKAMSM